jgi:hypothetical protein
MMRTFGNLNDGLLKAEGGVRWVDVSARYAVAAETTRCDGQGYFVFRNVPDGTYYVTANIFWRTPGSPFPGDWLERELMQRVEVAGGQAREVHLRFDTAPRFPSSRRRLIESL